MQAGAHGGKLKKISRERKRPRGSEPEGSDYWVLEPWLRADEKKKEIRL